MRNGLALSTAMEKIVEVQTDGAVTTELVPLADALPGEQVVYTVNFVNVSGQVLDNVRITQPIPANLRYVPNTAFGPGAQVLYSIDGGRSFGQPGELTLLAENGVRRAAAAADYTHVRWLLKPPLDASARGVARFRAVVR